jgi:hypothetical protein
MHGSFTKRVEEAREIERSIMQGTAELCSPGFGRACKGLWPVKTAENLASRVGCSVRAAAYQISGEHEPSARSIQVIINEIIPRR